MIHLEMKSSPPPSKGVHGVGKQFLGYSKPNVNRLPCYYTQSKQFRFKNRSQKTSDKKILQSLDSENIYKNRS